jgi:hypothetical protein
VDCYCTVAGDPDRGVGDGDVKIQPQPGFSDLAAC